MTERPLRAFLMMRSSDGTWTVTVCRDLGAVLRAWRGRGETDRDVGVLHVGFERPPSHCFDEVAAVHPGHMLLTTAAKHVFPKAFIASAAPIGVTETTEVFMGLHGWGYSREDPTAQGAHAEPVCPSAATQDPEGWVALFLHEEPSARETLSAHGIHDDDSYLERESELERSLRHRSGMFRAHHLVGEVGENCGDPCELASGAPPWLAERELTTLGLPVRADNVFRESEIQTVRDLASWSAVALLNQRNFGRKSLQDTLQALAAALKQGPPPPSPSVRIGSGDQSTSGGSASVAVVVRGP